MKTSVVLTDSRPGVLRGRSRPILDLIAHGLLSCLIAIPLAGCSNSKAGTGNAGQVPDPVQTYMAGAVGNLETYSVDHTANVFVVTCYSLACLQANDGAGIIQDSGSISQLGNGMDDLDITYYPGQVLGAPPLTSSWLVEIPGSAALVEVEATTSSTNATATSFAPLAPTLSCPSSISGETFQFVTVPKELNPTSTLNASSWNPQLETAYGSVSITTSGTSVNFANISQFTLPSANGGTPGAPVNPAPSTAATVCSPTFLGETIAYPSAVTVDNPGSQGSQSNSPSATIAIGPSGFLVEDSGSQSGVLNSSFPPYENLLGAGYGAIGIPRPSSALTTSSVAAAQYQGILYGAASGAGADVSDAGFRLIGSFGYQNVQTSCPTLPGPSSSTVLYGGEFANNDPSANSFGNCDLAIDLGNQDPNNNGLYPAATVYVSASFPNNGLNSAYSFSAVAVAGQINGKLALFLIGMDTTGVPAQPWGIYLLQSN